MNRFQNLSIDDFRAALQPDVVKSMQIIQSALALGVVLFGSIVAILYFSAGLLEPAEPQESEVQLVGLLTVASFALAIIVYSVAPLMEKRVLQQVKNDSSEISLTLQALNAIRSARLVRLAMYESAALLGLVTCFLAVGNRVIFTHPIYWINVVPAAILATYAAATFPNQERLVNTFREKLRDAG